MKKLIPLLAAVLLLAGFTSACRDGEAAVSTLPEDSTPPEVQDSQAPATSAPPETTPPAASTPSVQTSPDPTPPASPEPSAQQTYDGPDDEAILTAYRAAEQAFSWFQVEPMPLDHSISYDRDGLTYYRVDYPGIDSTASLRGYLKSLFSDDLVEQLLPYNGTQYIDIDGKLYGQDGGRGTDITRGGETVQVLRNDNPNRCTVQVTVEILDPDQDGAVVDAATYDFPYEKVGEKWIFTDFSLVR